MSLPSRPPGLSPRLHIQTMMDAWHRDRDRTVGFVELPSVLIIQLLRFKLHQGNVRKIRTEVHLDNILQVPTFTDDRLGTTSLTYQLCAYVVHHGLTPCSGHCTAALLLGPEYWLCNDAQPAVLFPEPPPQHYRDCCVLLYKRTSCHNSYDVSNAGTHHDS